MNAIRDPYSSHRPGMVSIISDISPIPSIRPNNKAHHGVCGTIGPNSHQHLYHSSEHNIIATRETRTLPNSTSASTASTVPTTNRLGSRSASQDSVYTILIRLPTEGATGDERVPSIKMIHDDLLQNTAMTTIATTGTQLTGIVAGSQATGRRPLSSRDSEYSLPLGRRFSHAPDLRIPLNAKIIPKNLKPVRQGKKKKKSHEKRQESKAARTLSAILLSFILTWTPYNILVLVKPLTNDCEKCIPQELWDFFYALCYINSLINPMCYALCNASFRRTYIRILTCKWHTRNREAMIRNMYN